MSKPTFNNECKAKKGGIEGNATITAGGTWKVQFISDTEPAPAACPAGTGADEMMTADDCIIFTIPKGGLAATFKLAGVNCTITFASVAAFEAGGTFTDDDAAVPVNPSTGVFNREIPAASAGGFPCPNANKYTLEATYTFSEPAAGVFTDPS
jgi:hypothetical protein